MCGFLVDTGSKSDYQTIIQAARAVSHRGPDQFKTVAAGGGLFVFHRLAIMDPDPRGCQPFGKPENAVLVCNGEIYNYKELKRKHLAFEVFQSESDCEILIPLYRRYGIAGMVGMLDAEFAFVLYDAAKDAFFGARDPIGIRPMFYGKNRRNGAMVFASEAKAVLRLCETASVFPPGHYFDGVAERFVRYHDITKVAQVRNEALPEIGRNIRELLTQAVAKRLQADAPVGYLLSGGLDSSLVCAIAARLQDKPIKTFAVGVDKDPIDLAYARDVATCLGTDHHEVTFTQQEVFDTLSQLIYHLETWDITTIRASIGMYLVCKYIHEKTDVKVLLTGEVSDELFGYKYTDFAPSPQAFQEEAAKRVRELYMYDVLRADRCISAHALEARVPFGDLDFAAYVMSIDPKLKMNQYGIGKYLLRMAFERGGYLPEHILLREKAAFSDAVGHSMVDNLKLMAETRYSDAQLAGAGRQYPHGTPFTKEALLYRDIFHGHFPTAAKLIGDYWMPNRSWANCDVADPSARALPNYGASGGVATAGQTRVMPVAAGG